MKILHFYNINSRGFIIEYKSLKEFNNTCNKITFLKNHFVRYNLFRVYDTMKRFEIENEATFDYILNIREDYGFTNRVNFSQFQELTIVLHLPCPLLEHSAVHFAS